MLHTKDIASLIVKPSRYLALWLAKVKHTLFLENKNAVGSSYLTLAISFVAGDQIMGHRYELLYQCFLTDQMSAAEIQAHMKADEVFRRWVERRIKERLARRYADRFRKPQRR